MRDLNVLEQRVLRIVTEAQPVTTKEVTERIGDRSRPTVSLALNRLMKLELVSKTGRDWRVTDVGRSRIGVRPPLPTEL